ncbi:Dynamin family-domain-containing protein [Mycena epipterygia]|nr:Dynamin family-domain-containing protein [Mycena epipterygia]
MDVNDFTQRDSDLENSESSLSDPEEWSESLPIDVYNFVVPNVQQLWGFASKFPSIPQEQRKAWAKTVARLTKATVPSYKFALIGKTGSGKSTLINCLLGHAILPSSAAVSCTSAITEIHYEDTDTIEGTILFLAENEWREQLNQLLDDIADNEADDSESPAFRSREKLFMVYPHLRNKELGSLTVTQLLQADHVRSKLGTSFKLPRTDADNFRTNLEEYLSSSTNTTRAALWPLIRRVEVRGKFSVLSSGVVLSDLPGYGDDNDTRNNFANEYIKHADGVILVADAKRAQDDRDTLSYLRHTLTQIVIDGRSVENFLVLAATGTDVSIGPNEIKLENHDQLKCDQLTKEIKDLRRSIHPPKKLNTKSKQQQKQQREVEDRIREREREMLFLLATVRTARVRTAIQDFFRQIHADLTPDSVNGTPKLPIFCVGSQDYLSLKSGIRTPSVFFDEAATEIPQLKTHLQTAGERRRIVSATRLLDQAYNLSEDIHLYFSEGRHPGRLQPENKNKAVSLIADLEKINVEEAEDAFDAIEDELGRVSGDLEKAVKKAADNCPRIMKEFGSKIHWNTYKATMRFNGVYYSYDLNRNFTRDILPAIQGSWNGGINHKIPLTLKDATARIEENTLAKITEIANTLNGQGNALEKSVAIARQSLAIEGLLSDMLGQAIESVSLAQRDGTRSFHSIIQKEMTPQYQSAFQQSGQGLFVRMKTSNVTYMEQHGAIAFNAINTHIEKLLRDALSKIKRDIRAELADITTLLRLSLVEEVNLSQEHKEAKEHILELTLESRPAFATKKIDLSDRRRSLGI